MTYVSGFLLPVKTDRKEEYVESARKAWPLFKEYGALSHVECWGDAVPDGKVTDFPRSVKLEEGETVVFSWITWPDKATSDRCDASMESDERWQGLMDDMMRTVDGKRMVYGGFEMVMEEKA